MRRAELTAWAVVGAGGKLERGRNATAALYLAKGITLKTPANDMVGRRDGNRVRLRFNCAVRES